MGCFFFLKKDLPSNLGRMGKDPGVGAEEVVGVAQLALGLVGLVVVAELGDAEHLGDAAHLHVCHLLLRRLVTLALVVLHDEADLRLVGVEQRVRDLHRHQLVAALLGHPPGGHQDTVVVAVAVLLEELHLALGLNLLEVLSERRHRLLDLRGVHPGFGRHDARVARGSRERRRRRRGLVSARAGRVDSRACGVARVLEARVRTFVDETRASVRRRARAVATVATRRRRLLHYVGTIRNLEYGPYFDLLQIAPSRSSP
jgi:hypothetical protein